MLMKPGERRPHPLGGKDDIGDRVLDGTVPIGRKGLDRDHHSTFIADLACPWQGGMITIEEHDHRVAAVFLGK